MVCLLLFQKSTGLGLNEGQGGACPQHLLCCARFSAWPRKERPHESSLVVSPHCDCPLNDVNDHDSEDGGLRRLGGLPGSTQLVYTPGSEHLLLALHLTNLI